MNSPKKYILYAYIKPYELKLCLSFPIDFKIRFIQEYIEDTMRNFRSKYKVGRIEHKKTSSILLPDFKIGETLEDKDELIVYSIEYGLTKKSLDDKKTLEDIDKLFIAKKTKRETRTTSRKISIDISEKNIKENKQNSSYDNEDEENGNKNEKDEEQGSNNDNNNNLDVKEDSENESIEEEEKKFNKKKNKIKKNAKKDASSDSGEDNSEDIQL